MKKLWLLLGLVAALSVAAQAERLTMVPLNGQPMVALYTFANAYGAIATYDGTNDVITITLGSRTVEMIPYWGWAWIDGQQVSVTAPPVIVDSTVYIPIRFIADTFGLPINWITWDREVIVDYPVNHLSWDFFLDEDFDRHPHEWRFAYPDFHRPFFDRDEFRQMRQDRDFDFRAGHDRGITGPVPLPDTNGITPPVRPATPPRNTPLFNPWIDKRTNTPLWWNTRMNNGKNGFFWNPINPPSQHFTWPTHENADGMDRHPGAVQQSPEPREEHHDGDMHRR